jgi:hypothetical protein
MWIYRAVVTYVGFGVSFSVVAAFIFGLWYDEERPSRWINTLLRFPTKDPCDTITGDYTFNVLVLGFFWPVVIAIYLGIWFWCVVLAFGKSVRWVVAAPFRLGRYLAKRRARLPEAKVQP